MCKSVQYPDPADSTKTLCRFNAPGHVEDTQLGANVRREVFLIFKEAVNNIVKHSQCSEVRLELAVEDGWLMLSIEDNGKGFDPALVKASTGYLSSQRSGGNGLASMRRRAKEMGGEFDIETGVGQGATMSLRMPIRQGSDLTRAAINAGGCR